MDKNRFVQSQVLLILTCTILNMRRIVVENAACISYLISILEIFLCIQILAISQI